MGFTGYTMLGLAAAFTAALAWAAYRGALLDTAEETVKARDATITRLNHDVAQAKIVNDDNVKTIADLKLKAAQVDAIAATYAAIKRDFAARLNAALEDIANAPANDDGPVAPILARQLERMRGRQTGAGGIDPPPARAAASPGR